MGRSYIDVDRLLVIDLEATCWTGKPPPGQFNEIIEIGNAMLDLKDGTITPGPELLVKPTKSSISPFCTELTTITQEMVDERGTTLWEAIKALHGRWGELSLIPWASYGDYDLIVLSNHCRIHEIEFPLSRSFTNVKRLVTMLAGWTKPVGMMETMERMDIEHEGMHHRGGDDACNIARVLWHMCQKMRT